MSTEFLLDVGYIEKYLFCLQISSQICFGRIIQNTSNPTIQQCFYVTKIYQLQPQFSLIMHFLSSHNQSRWCFAPLTSARAIFGTNPPFFEFCLPVNRGSLHKQTHTHTLIASRRHLWSCRYSADNRHDSISSNFNGEMVFSAQNATSM